jgi:hypothetical protein
VVRDDLMAHDMYEHYNSILGSSFKRSRRINLGTIRLLSLELSGLEDLFTEDEVRPVVMDLQNDKAPGPDGFTGMFYKKAWDVIKVDIMNVFNAFWSQGARSPNYLNDAYMILLKKKPQPVETTARSA